MPDKTSNAPVKLPALRASTKPVTGVNNVSTYVLALLSPWLTSSRVFLEFILILFNSPKRSNSASIFSSCLVLFLLTRSITFLATAGAKPCSPLPFVMSASV